MQAKDSDLAQKLTSAIQNRDESVVLYLLENGVDLKDPQEEPPLYWAIKTYDAFDSRCRTILKALLAYEADPVEEFIYECSQYTIFEWMLEHQYEQECFELLFEVLKRKDKLNLAQAACTPQYKVFEYFLKNGITNGAFQGLDFLVINDEEYTDDANILTLTLDYDRYKIFKTLYVLSLKENFSKVESAHHNIMLLLSIRHLDFYFSLALLNSDKITKQITNLTYQINRYIEYLLFMKKYTKTDAVLAVIIMLCRNANKVYFYERILTQQNLIQPNNSSYTYFVDGFKLINSVITTAVMTFINPCQQTLSEHFDESIRIKLAINYICLEAPFLKYISFQNLEKMILDYHVKYYLQHYRIARQYIVNAASKNSTIALLWKDKLGVTLTKLIDHWLEKCSEVFYSTELRQDLANKVKFINYYGNNLETNFVNSLSYHLNYWEKENHGYLASQRNFLSKYTYLFLKKNLLIFSVKTKNEELFYRSIGYIGKTIDIKDYDNFIKYFLAIQNILEMGIETRDWFLWQTIKFYSNCNNIEILEKIFFNKIIPSDQFLEDQNNQQNIFKVMLWAIRKNYSKLTKLLLTTFSNLEESYYVSLFSQVIIFKISDQNLIDHLFSFINKNNAPTMVDALAKWFLMIVHNHYFHMVTVFFKNFDQMERPIKEAFVYKITDTASPKDKIAILPYFLDCYVAAYPQHSDFKELKQSLRKKQPKITIDDEQKLRQFFLKYIPYKIYNKKIIPYLQSLYPLLIKQKHQAFLDRLHCINYKFLTSELNQSNNLYLSKGQILTQQEKLLYQTLMALKWKLTHRVGSIDDLKKIIRDNEIQSILYRKKNLIPVDNIHTPSYLNSDGHIFLTLGPVESPTPIFLKNCPAIEFDVDRLLQLHPKFFDHAMITSHWFAFASTQEFDSFAANGTTCFTSHHLTKQYTEFFSADQFHLVETELKDIIFIGRRLIHILCLLFIKQIRLLGSFYDEILTNYENHIFLSHVFSEIMHSGLVEIRYPYKIPLHNSYTRIIDPPMPTNYLEIGHEINAPADLQLALKKGYDPNELIEIKVTGTNTEYFIGDILTKAILEQNKSLIDFIIDNHYLDRRKKKVNALSPVEVAVRMNDCTTLFKLLTKGYPSKIPSLRRIPQPGLEALLFLLKNLALAEIAILIKSLPFRTRNELLIKLLAKDVFYNLNNPVQIIQLLLDSISIDDSINLSEQTFSLFITTAIDTDNKELLFLLSSYNFDFLEISVAMDEFLISPLSYAIFYEKYHLLEVIAKEFQPTTLADDSSFLISLLFLSVSKDEANFYNYASLVLPNIFQEPLYYENILYHLISWSYNISPDVINTFITQVSEISLSNEAFDFAKVNLFFQILSKDEQLSIILKNTDSLEVVNKIAHATHHLNDYQLIKLLIQEKYKNAYLLIGSIIYMDLIITDQEAEALISLLKPYPIFVFSIYKKCPQLIIKNITTFVDTILHLDSHQIPFSFLENTIINTDSRFLILFFTRIQQYFGDTYIIKFLIFLMNGAFRKELLNSLLKEEFKLFIANNLNSLLTNINSMSISPETKFRLLLILFELSPTFNLEKISSSAVHWGTKIGLRHFLLKIPANNIVLTNSHSLDNPFLPSQHRSIGAAFITCLVGNKVCLFLGRKKSVINNNLPLLAPGGFIEFNEKDVSFLGGVFREIQEETQLNLKALPTLGSSISVDEFLKEFGKVFFIPNRSTINFTPSQISLIGQFNNLRHYNSKGQPVLQTAHFYWLEFDFDMTQHLKSSDDFTQGQWIALSDIYYSTQNNKYYYHNQEILTSNAMMIDLIQGKLINQSTIKDQLELESLEKHKALVEKRIGIYSFFQQARETNPMTALKQSIHTFYESKSANKKHRST